MLEAGWFFGVYALWFLARPLSGSENARSHVPQAIGRLPKATGLARRPSWSSAQPPPSNRVTSSAEEEFGQRVVGGLLRDGVDVERLERWEGPSLRASRHDDHVADAHLEDALARTLGVDDHLHALKLTLKEGGHLLGARLEYGSGLACFDRDDRKRRQLVDDQAAGERFSRIGRCRSGWWDRCSDGRIRAAEARN